MSTPNSLTGRQRTLDFLAGEPVDRPPFHPIIMRWAAKYAGAKYRDFCLDPQVKSAAMAKCAADFDFDWVTVMSDPWAETSAFGIDLEYPEDDLPVDVGGHLPDLEAAAKLQPYQPLAHARCVSRIREIEEFKRLHGDQYFVVGWVEGPVAAYADIRGVSNAAMDFLDDPETCGHAMDVIVDCAKEFIALQIQAGADCVGIGDAFCSQIGPKLYHRLAFEREKELVAHIHSLGAKAKLHICGNTTAILPGMIDTGADIIDIDHLVATVEPFTPQLAPHQVFSGKADPVSVIQNGSRDAIAKAVSDMHAQAAGRCIVSAGCEITPGTPLDTMRFFRQTADGDPATATPE